MNKKKITFMSLALAGVLSAVPQRDRHELPDEHGQLAEQQHAPAKLRQQPDRGLHERLRIDERAVVVQGSVGMQRLIPATRAAASLLGAVALVLTAPIFVGCVAHVPPDAGPTSDSGGDYAEDMTACLRAAGWDVTARPDGGVSAKVLAGQASAYDADRDRCERDLGHDLAPPPMTDEQIRALYREVLDVVDCLVKEGQDPGVPPIEQQFIDQAHDMGAWDPYTNINRPGVTSEAEYFALLSSCPRTW